MTFGSRARMNKLSFPGVETTAKRRQRRGDSYHSHSGELTCPVIQLIRVQGSQFHDPIVASKEMSSSNPEI
jgi:hypothetical protein